MTLFQGRDIALNLNEFIKQNNNRKVIPKDDNREVKFSLDEFMQYNGEPINDTVHLIETKYPERHLNCIQRLLKYGFDIIKFAETYDMLSFMEAYGHLNYICRYKEWKFMCHWTDYEDYNDDIRDENEKIKESDEKYGCFYLHSITNVITKKQYNISVNLNYSKDPNLMSKDFYRLMDIFNNGYEQYHKKYVDDQLLQIKELEKFGFKILEVNNQTRYGSLHPNIHIKVQLPEELYSSPDYQKAWRPKDKYGLFKEKIKSQYENIKLHQYYINIFHRCWNDEIIYTVSTEPSMDSNYHRPSISGKVENFWVDIEKDVKDIKAEDYKNNLIYLDKLVYNQIGFNENNKIFTNFDFRKMTKGKRVGFKFNEISLNCPINCSIFITRKPISCGIWFSENNNNYLKTFYHQLKFKISYKLEDDKVLCNFSQYCEENNRYNGRPEHPQEDLQYTKVHVNQKEEIRGLPTEIIQFVNNKIKEINEMYQGINEDFDY